MFGISPFFIHFVISALVGIAITVGLTFLIIKYVPKGWRTTVSTIWTPLVPVIINALDVVKDVDWNLFTERKGLAAGIAIGVSFAWKMTKTATVAEVKKETIAAIMTDTPVKMEGADIKVEPSATITVEQKS